MRGGWHSRIGPEAQRWILSAVGAVLLAVPALLMSSGASRDGGVTAGMPEWLSLSITAGVFLLHWGPALLGALLIVYANRRGG